MKNQPTGKYRNCKYWPEVVEAAKRLPELKKVVNNYLSTGHPACLNAIMDNADANLWITYYTGRIVGPA